MAGRGHGRRTLGLDPVGTSRGDSLPPAVQQPTPVFPVMEQKPLPLAGGEESEYLTALKQDFRVAMRSQPCFIQPAAAHRDVERYSDKYHPSDKMDGLTDWIIDWKRFPKELRVQIRKPRDGAALSRLAAPPSGQKKKKKKVGEKEEVLLKLETLEKKEQQESSEEEGEEQKEDEAEAEEEYDEEEFEEETDYIMSYFDNGEDFGGDSDDNMDEAVY
ncbi:DNA-directed RNA polymerase III subunit RPC7-like isoform X2 [Xiphophorus hellerii]|nr:DNA-directed RNA polymerase III subunit RPC7-like isoform X2 [Xiphophorus hellerii]XP_032415450.1 DNA-directed RNA polymerase III subunit RPC7-like isoform X2 [Xiphophorus hellerii]XP_032415451.1 DNA-directed RNA polymerase III subunit RPC7-like isoform X2 [Xiphophorus hellerii]